MSFSTLFVPGWSALLEMGRGGAIVQRWAGMHPDGLATSWVLSAFGETRPEAVAEYSRFVAQGHRQATIPCGPQKQRLFLGSDAFVGSVRRRLPAGSDLREVPQARARPVPKLLADFARQCADRNGAITAAYASVGDTLKDVGDCFGLLTPAWARRCVSANGRAKRKMERPGPLAVCKF